MSINYECITKVLSRHHADVGMVTLGNYMVALRPEATETTEVKFPIAASNAEEFVQAFSDYAANFDADAVFKRRYGIPIDTASVESIIWDAESFETDLLRFFDAGRDMLKHNLGCEIQDIIEDARLPIDETAPGEYRVSIPGNHITLEFHSKDDDVKGFVDALTHNFFEYDVDAAVMDYYGVQTDKRPLFVKYELDEIKDIGRELGEIAKELQNEMTIERKPAPEVLRSKEADSGQTTVAWTPRPTRERAVGLER